VPSRPWRLPLHGVHPGLEVSPPLFSDSNLGLGDGSGVLSEGVQEDDQFLGPSVQHPVQFAPVMAPELSQLSAHLGAVGKGKVRGGRRQHVQTVDLVVERYLALGIQSIDEVVDRLGPVRRTVGDSLKVRHRVIVAGPIGALSIVALACLPAAAYIVRNARSTAPWTRRHCGVQ